MATPTNQEQELLELINRARMDPDGEVDRLILNASERIGADPGITNALKGYNVDIDAFRQDMAGRAPVAPLAWNSNLAEAAERHSQAMIRGDQQSHQLPGEAGLGDRAEAAGVKDWSSLGENIFAFSNSPLDAHGSFVIDWGLTPTGMQQPAGHRDAMLSKDFTEVGIDATPENNPATQTGPLVVTQDFAHSFNTEPQLVGVAFRDKDGDNFYDAGEGIGGQTVTLTGVSGTFTTTTWESGGYQLKAPAGDYKVTFTGAGADERAYNVTIDDENVHLNNNVATPATKPVETAQTKPAGPATPDPVANKPTDVKPDDTKTPPTQIEQVAETDDTDPADIEMACADGSCLDSAEIAALWNSLLSQGNGCGPSDCAPGSSMAMQGIDPFNYASACAGFDAGPYAGCGQQPAMAHAFQADSAGFAACAPSGVCMPTGLMNDCMFA